MVIDRNNVKVGRTSNLINRLRAYQTTNPEAKIISFYECGKAYQVTEKLAQRDLRSIGFIPNHGEMQSGRKNVEWFKATPQMIKYLTKWGFGALKTFQEVPYLIYNEKTDSFIERDTHKVILENNYKKISNHC